MALAFLINLVYTLTIREDEKNRFYIRYYIFIAQAAISRYTSSFDLV